MYAVIETGGKQYRVKAGDIMQFEKLGAEKGKSVKFDQVLLFSKGKGQVTIGKPTVAKAAVAGEVLSQGRGEKIRIAKHKRRKRYERHKGHRQHYTQVLITEVDSGAGDKTSLSDAEKKTATKGFFSLLKPIGPVRTLKNRKTRLPYEEYQKKQAAKKKKTAKKAAPKTAAKKAPAKTAAAKSTSTGAKTAKTSKTTKKPATKTLKKATAKKKK